MKVDFNKQVKNLGGEELPGDVNNIGKILANMLAYSASGPLVKFMDWARALYKGVTLEIDRADLSVLRALYKGVTLEIDRADLSVLRAFVENSNLPNLTKEQLLNILDAAIKKAGA